MRTALLLEEQAARLSQSDPRRTHLLGLAKASRQAAVETDNRKQAAIEILREHNHLDNEEAEFLCEVAARFGRRGFFPHETSDIPDGARMVFRLHDKAVLVAAISEESTKFGLDVLYRWVASRLEA